MPRVPLHYLPKLVGYTMPVVIDAIDEIKPPVEIQKIPDGAQKGPILVTLAAQLANIVADAIYHQLAQTPEHHRFRDYYEIHGGSRYRKLLLGLERACQRRAQARSHLVHLETRFLARDTATFDHGKWPNGKKVKSPLAGILTWNGHLGKGLAETQCMYGKAADEYRKYSKDCEDLVKAIEDEEIAIKSVTPPEEVVRTLRLNAEDTYVFRSKGQPISRSVRFRVTEKSSLLEAGAGFYLRNTEPRWWRLFSDQVEHQVSLDYAGQAQRLMLRDPLLHNAIENLLAEKKGGRKVYTIERAAQEVLEKPAIFSPRLNWPPRTLTGDTVRQTRTTLKKQDEDAYKWVKARSGERHPLDPYRNFRSRLAHLEEDRLRYDFEKGYDHCRAENELLWCLARRQPESFPFRGAFANARQQESWRERVRKSGGAQLSYHAYLNALKVI
jgi:hypothetical protein